MVSGDLRGCLAVFFWRFGTWIVMDDDTPGFGDHIQHTILQNDRTDRQTTPAVHSSFCKPDLVSVS
jgi:hypothetical protein